MTMWREALLHQAAAKGFSPATLEKVLRLLAVLDALNRHPATSGKLVDRISSDARLVCGLRCGYILGGHKIYRSRRT